MKIDIFRRFNRKGVQDRQIDTLIGLAHGITADGQVDMEEAEYLQNWLQQNAYSQNPVLINLLGHVTSMLDDGVFDPEEAIELLDLLRKITGEKSDPGEVAKTSSLPLNDPMPDLDFADRVFVCTGTFAYGTRNECQEAILTLGGQFSKNVTKKVDFLVLGTYVTETWAHETYGRKIEKAIEYREAGTPIAIVSEQHWADSAALQVHGCQRPSL